VGQALAPRALGTVRYLRRQVGRALEVQHQAVEALEQGVVELSGDPRPLVDALVACASGEAAVAGGSTLMATSRPSLVSVPRYTSPIPPAPRREAMV
jgi:hypothetical protein